MRVAGFVRWTARQCFGSVLVMGSLAEVVLRKAPIAFRRGHVLRPH